MLKSLAMTAILATSPVLAETVTTPSDLAGNDIISQGFCSDNETGDRGYCFMVDGEGDVVYLVFHEFEGNRVRGPVFMRRVAPGEPYETIWHRDTNEPMPSGMPL